MYCSLKRPQSIKKWNGNFVIGTLQLLEDIHEIKEILCWRFKYSIMLRPVDWKTDTGVSDDCTATIFTVKKFMETQLGLFGPQHEGTTIPPSSGNNPADPSSVTLQKASFFSDTLPELHMTTQKIF